jgi:hypothetical protein
MVTNPCDVSTQNLSVRYCTVRYGTVRYDTVLLKMVCINIFVDLVQYFDVLHSSVR